MAGNNFNQEFVPQNIDMQAIRSAIVSANDFAKSCRFVAIIQGNSQTISNIIPKDLYLMCEAVEFPGRGFDYTEVRYSGPKQAFPNNPSYEPIGMSFLCRNDSKERAFFDDWMDIINPTDTFLFEYPENYWATITLLQLSDIAAGGEWNYVKDPGHTPQNMLGIYGFALYFAWPMLVSPQQVSWADQDVLRLQVSMTYKYWDRPYYQG
mgnify:CR=1 FL=1